AAVPYLTVGNELSSFSESEYDRRSVVSEDMMNELLISGRDNEEARDILEDLSSPPGFYQAGDPLLDAVKFINENMPEFGEKLEQAAITSYQTQSHDALLDVVGEAARSDPQFEQRLRYHIGQSLQSRRTEDQRTGVELLMTMSDRWTAGDMVTALEYMRPDQIMDFKTAVSNAPQDVRTAFYRSLINQDRGAVQDPGLSLFGAQPQIDFRQRIDVRDTTPRLSIDGFSGFNDMSVPPLSERAKARLAFMNQSPDSFDPFRRQSLLRPHGDSMGFQFPPAGGRIGGSGLNQLLIDNLNLSRQQQQQARDTFSQAWPDERRPYSLSIGALSDSRSHEAHDTRYLSATLDSHIRDSRETISVEQLFVNNWGIDPASDNFSEKMAKAVEKHGADTLLKVDQRLQLYNALNPELRQELTGSTESLEPSQIAGMILNGKLGKKGLQGSFLLDNPPLEQKLAQKLRESTESLRTERQELRQETGEFEEALTILEEYTKDGVGAGAMLDHGIDKLLDLLTYASVSPLPITGRSLSDLRTSGLERWEQRQEQLVEDFVTNDQEALAKVKSVADLGGRVGRMEFAEDVLAYQGLAQQEDSQERRDYMALGMLDKYGMEAIRENAPAVWKDLNNGGLTRLKEKGLIQSDQLPSFSGSSLDQQQQAFAMLRNLSRAETGNLDLPMRRKEALKIVDSDPALGKAYETMAEFSQDFAAFQRLFEAGQQGTKYEDYVDLVRENAKNLQDTLGKVTPEDIEGMRRTLDGLEQSIHEGGDPATQAALQLRRESLEAMLGILDPDSEQNQNINKLLDQAQSRDFNEDTLGNWFKENGPVIAVAAAAVAVTVASMGTAAPALAVVLASSAVALAATQGTKEVLYLVNHHIGDTGLGNLNDRSYYGAWTANHWDTFGELFTSENGWEGKSEAAQELMSSYLSEVAGPMSLEYAQNVVMGLVGVGALRVGSAGFRGLSPQWVKSLVANPRSAAMLKQLANSESTAGKSFAQQWMALGRETGQEIVEEVGEEGFQTVASRALEQSGVSGPLGNMLLIATMSIGRARGQSVIARYRGGGNVDLDTSTAHNVVADLENTGHLVRNNGDGTYTVSAYNDPNSAMTIRAVEQNAAVDHDTSVESGGRPASDVEFDATPDASGDLADTSAGARRHSPDAPVGPSTEIDTRIRNLANELDAVAPGSEAATRIERQIHDSLMDQARDYARRMGLVTRNADGEITGYILDPAKIELVRGDVDSSHGQDDVIRINIDRGNPTADLFHEMKHRSEVLERTSIAMADPAAYNQRIQQDVFGELEQGGNRRLAMRDGEVTVVDRTELSTKEQKQQLAGLLRQFAAEHDTIDAASAADLESWLANNDGASYFAQQGIDQASLASLMKQEIESYRIIRDQSILPSAVVEQDLALSGFLESRGGSYARRAENGQPISNDPELHKLTRGVTEETLGIAGDPAGYHAFSPSERRAESAELARDMGLLLDQNADASIDSEKNVMRLHQVSLALNTALGKHRAQTDPASRDALWQQAQGAANDLVDMLPQSELGRDISRRLVDMGLVDNANLPPGLRVTGDGVETNGDISTGSGADTPDYDGDNRRRSTQNNPLESVRITGRTDQVVRDLASTNATVRDAATRSEIGRLMALPNPTAADVGELHRMRRSLFDSMRADQVESRELTALYDRQEAGQKLTEAESARMAELEPRFGEVNGRIRQNIEFTISMLRAEAEVARGGSSSKGGDSTEGMILHLFEKELDTPQAIFNGRTPREKGYEIVPLVKSSAMDDAGADFILVNKYSGEFMFIDPTQKSIHSPKKARLPELRKQGIISSDPRDPKYTLGNDADLGSLEYKARREDDIRRQIRGILAQAKDGSPLNIAEMFVPPSTEVARS
ncbi:MAG: hypothetical protein KC652_21710, partial [Cyanobacteria bacterium HKST-UBA01]|nr:hypothetical protein [Cyanobacteria bacterium HKST-UBA01]